MIHTTITFFNDFLLTRFVCVGLSDFSWNFLNFFWNFLIFFWNFLDRSQFSLDGDFITDKGQEKWNHGRHQEDASGHIAKSKDGLVIVIRPIKVVVQFLQPLKHGSKKVIIRTHLCRRFSSKKVREITRRKTLSFMMYLKKY